MIKKIVAIGIISMFILTSFSVLSAAKMIAVDEDNYDRWAVIIGIADYISTDDAPMCDYDAVNIYTNLIYSDEGGWSSNNIRLLLDDNAKRQDILDALDWLENNADEGDIVMFSFSGHGSFIPDENGDEWDDRDEIICPHDFYFDESGKPRNPLTDDELAIKFNEIHNKNIEGMFINFNSCLSGDLFDLQIDDIINEKSLTPDEKISIINEMIEEANIFSNELTKDINPIDNVLLAATIPHSVTFIGANEEGEYYTFGKAVWKAVEAGCTTAEDISRYAKMWWLSKPMVAYFMLLNLNPLWWKAQLQLYLEDGFIFVPLPMWIDGYPADQPLSAELPILEQDDIDTVTPSEVVSQVNPVKIINLIRQQKSQVARPNILISNITSGNPLIQQTSVIKSTPTLITPLLNPIQPNILPLQQASPQTIQSMPISLQKLVISKTIN